MLHPIFRHRPASSAPCPRQRRPERLLALLCLLALFGWFQNHALCVDALTLYAADLPAGFDGLRITVLADLHGQQFGPGSRQLLERVAQTQPELIVLPGDLYDRSTDPSALTPLLQGLCRIAPVFYVTGNHEWAQQPVRQVERQLRSIAGLGVTVLDNDWRLLRRGGDTILLCGVCDPNGPYDMPDAARVIAAARGQCAEPSFLLLLAHRNDRLPLWASLGADVVLCGHGHGGMIRLPGIGGLFSPDRRIPARWDSGVFRSGGTRMVVSRGLGSASGLRLFNRPQVLTVTLHSGAES